MHLKLHMDKSSIVATCGNLFFIANCATVFSEISCLLLIINLDNIILNQLTNKNFERVCYFLTSKNVKRLELE